MQYLAIRRIAIQMMDYGSMHVLFFACKAGHPCHACLAETLLVIDYYFLTSYSTAFDDGTCFVSLLYIFATKYLQMMMTFFTTTGSSSIQLLQCACMYIRHIALDGVACPGAWQLRPCILYVADLYRHALNLCNLCNK